MKTKRQPESTAAQRPPKTPEFQCHGCGAHLLDCETTDMLCGDCRHEEYLRGGQCPSPAQAGIRPQQETLELAPALREAPWGLEPRRVPVARGRVLQATPVFDTYWRFAVRRQALFMNRVLGAPPPWTDDPILRRYRFTNAYRASDRVSQYLIRHVMYEGAQTPEEIFFRVLLFKIFNRVDTWEALVARIGAPRASTFEPGRYAGVLDERVADRKPVYSPAYIMPNPPFGERRKHRNHLLLLAHMLKERAPARIACSGSLESVYATLLSYPSIGPFLAFQLAIDLNYSTMIDFSEMSFVVAGPGARDGIRKCFSDTDGLKDSDVIRAVHDISAAEFDRQGLSFPDLWGRSLHLIDYQNIFCEVDKYARVAHPSQPGVSRRTRIKQKFSPRPEALPQWYPPKWGVTVPSQ